MWNKQRKDEVLIDVEDVAAGHTTKLQWNDPGKWLWSDNTAQPPIIDRDTFDQVQDASLRAEANRLTSPISARMTSAVNGPTPGS